MIERFPTQIYVSVSVFSPTKSRLRKTYEIAESPKWLTTKPAMRQEWGDCLQTFEGSQKLINEIHSVTFSPDNSKLVSIIGAGVIEVWDLTIGGLLQRLHGNMSAINAALSSNGNTLALLSHHDVQIWDPINGSLLKKIDHNGIKSVAFIAGDAHLSMLGPKIFKIHDIAKNVDLYAYSGPPGEKFRDIVFSSRYAQLLALSGANGGIKTRDLANWTLVPSFTNKTFGARLVVTCKQETSTLLKVLDLAAGEYMQMILRRETSLGQLLFFLTSDGMRLVVRHHCEMIRIWDLATGRWQTIDFPDKTLGKAAFSPCRMRLALANDEDIYVWDAASGEYRWASTSHANRTAAMAFSPDGSRLALGAFNGTIKVLELTASRPLQSPKSRPDTIVEMVYSLSGKWLASRSCNGIKLWDPNTGECLRTWRTPSKPTALAFSLDSVWLAIGDKKGIIRVYDTATGAWHQTLASAEYDNSHIDSNSKNSAIGSIDSMAFPSNGSTIASVEPDSRTYDDKGAFTYTLKTWDLATGKCLQAVTLSGWGKFYNSIAMLIFSPDNTQLGSILRNGTVIVWDALTGEHLQTLVDHEKPDSPYRFKKPQYWEYSMTTGIAKSLAALSDHFSRTQGSVLSNKVPELAMSKDNEWILWKKEPKIGLPLEYRPRIFVAHEDYCAIATYSHEVLCFRFSV